MLVTSHYLSKFLCSLPVQLILAVIGAFFLGTHLDSGVVAFWYTVSCFLKDYLLFILPFVIMGYISSAVIGLDRRAPLLILGLLSLVTFSNFFATQSAYYISRLALPFITGSQTFSLTQSSAPIEALWIAPFPAFLLQVLTPGVSMMAGLMYGLICSFIKAEGPKRLSIGLRNVVTFLLQKTFIPFLPLYVFGFILKMQKEGSLGGLLQNCGQIMILMCSVIIIYVLVLFALAYGFNLRKMGKGIQHMMPAAITGFTTMSSAATMPVTLQGTEKNLPHDPQFVHLMIPTSVNIHMVGDSLGIPILALAVLQLSGLPLPSVEAYMSFTLYCCLAKFGSAGVPGGSVLILQSLIMDYLNLTPEMYGLMATLYILQDSVFTSSNVMGNGAFAVLAHRILRAVGLVKQGNSQEEIADGQ